MGTTLVDMQKHTWVSKLELSIFDRSVLSVSDFQAERHFCLRSCFNEDVPALNFGKRVSQEEFR